MIMGINECVPISKFFNKLRIDPSSFYIFKEHIHLSGNKKSYFYKIQLMISSESLITYYATIKKLYHQKVIIL